jgi:peptide/nickel transport system substrate-binding protein
VQDYKNKEENFASRNVMGTGAYRILGWSPDVSVRMEDHLGWWDKRDGNVTRVNYTPVKADATRIAALLSGEVDLVTDLPTQDVARLRADQKLKVLDGPEVRTIYIALDQGSNELKTSNVKGKNPFKDKKVRQALNMLTDRETIRRTIMRGMSIPAGIMVAPGVNGNSADIDRPVAFDVEAAKKLLTEAGYPQGFEFTLACPNNRYVNDEEICQALVAMWARAGVKARVSAEPMSTHAAKLQKFEFDAYMLGWGVATYDAQYAIQSLIRTKTTGANGNFNWHKLTDTRIDELTDAMATETDVAKRNAMIREVLVRTRDEHYFIPIHHQMRPWAMKKGVTTTHRSDDRPEARFTKVEGGS